LDFIANFLPPVHPGVADRIFRAGESVEKIFARPVDLLDRRPCSATPVLRDEIARDRTPIYDYEARKRTA